MFYDFIKKILITKGTKIEKKKFLFFVFFTVIAVIFLLNNGY